MESAISGRDPKLLRRASGRPVDGSKSARSGIMAVADVLYWFMVVLIGICMEFSFMHAKLWDVRIEST